MNTLYVMVGISGSGKSVISKKISEALNIPRFSSDEIRGEVCNGDMTDQSKNGYVFKLFHERIEAALNIGSVVADATNVKLRDRTDLYKIALKCRSKIVAVVMTTDFDDCNKFNESRDRVVPKFVLEKQFNALTVPSLNEVSEIFYVHWQTDEVQHQRPNVFELAYCDIEEFLTKLKS